MARWILLGLVAGMASVAAADEQILSQLKSGQFTGTVASKVNQAFHGKTGKLTVQKMREGTLFTLVLEGAQGKAREEWLLQGDTLIQREYNAAGKRVAEYNAIMTAEQPIGASRATFKVHCEDSAKNICDNGIDARNTWTLAVEGDTVKYIVQGIPSPADRNNPKAQIVTRHEITFQATR